MKTPPLLFAAALLFWGWQTGYLLFAVPMAAALEGTRLLRRRWQLSPKDFYRIADLCALIFLFMFAFRFLANTASMARWIPFGIFPLLLAQSLSTVGGVDLGAIFYTERKKEKRRGGKDRNTTDVTWPSVVLVLLAASAANVRTPAFFIGVFFIAALALWTVRPTKRSAALWAVVLLCTGALGWAGHVGLRRLHLAIDEAALQWYMENRAFQRNPLRNVTAIGEVGSLKRSDRIVMRVAAREALPESGLLREASYSIYRSGRWMAADSEFSRVAAGDREGSWRFSNEKKDVKTVELEMVLPGGEGFLALPMGVAGLENLPALRIEKNRFGAVRVKGGPELADVTVRCGDLPQGEAPPGPADLALPEKEAPVVRRAAEALSLAGLSPQAAASRVASFFREKFAYSLTQKEGQWGVLPLENFLFHTRSGHCEYFATATVLMLRAAGIASRYAVGYRAAEFSQLEGRYVVRSRHAHAWAQVFIDGRWSILDTTPAQWVALEEKEASSLEPVIDLFRWLGYRVKKWEGLKGRVQKSLPWMLLPLGLVLVWRIVFRKRGSTLQKRTFGKKNSPTEDRAISRLAGIEARLAEEGFARATAETHLRRLERTAAAGADPAAMSELREILSLHYRDRFHPDGISDAGRDDLDARISAWLRAYAQPGSLFREKVS